MKITINVVLPKNRDILGTFTMVADDGYVLFGPVACLGKSDNGAAIAAGNPTRDMLKKDGDHPLGLSSVTIVAAAPEAECHSYGPNKRFALTPISGPAKLAMREGILDHGGDLNLEYTQWGGRRPTLGCLRLTDEDMASAIKIAEQAEEILQNVTEPEDLPVTS